MKNGDLNKNVTEAKESEVKERISDLFTLPTEEDLKECEEGQVLVDKFDEAKIEYMMQDGELGFRVVLPGMTEKPAAEAAESVITVSRIYLSNMPSNQSWLVGWGDAKVGDITVYDIKVIKSKNKPGTFFARFPKNYNKKTNRGYNTVRFPNEIYNKILDAVIKAVVEKAGQAAYVPVTVTAPVQQQPAAPAQTQPANVPGGILVDDLAIAGRALEISNGIYSSVAIVLGQPVKTFSNGAVRGLDLDGFRLLQQNPGTGSDYARQVREGHRVIWLIVPKNTPKNPGTSDIWYGVIIDGKFEKRAK